MARNLARTSPDGLLLFAVAALLSVGVIMVYSTTAHLEGVNIIRELALQFGTGFVGLVAGLLLPLAAWRRITVPGLVIVALALISLLVPGNPLAYDGGGAVRWLGVPPFVIQPSELAKLFFILFAAGFLARWSRGMTITRGLREWALFLAVLGGHMIVIYLEPDLGTAIVLGGIAFCMLWMAQVDWKPLVLGLLLAAMVVYVAATNTEHQAQRLQAWWNPWEYHQEGGHQVIQSWTAMARGGWFGVGLGNSLQKLDDRLPEAETDFVFAVLAEEMGLIRAAGVILLYALFAWRGYTIALRAPDRFTALVAGGITSWIVLQAGMNIGVVTGTIPNTGVPLPFLSSGGSATLALMTGVGLLANISRCAVAVPAKAPARRRTPRPASARRR